MLDTPIRRSLVLHNKSPMWNEASQVYQLDFGGRMRDDFMVVVAALVVTSYPFFYTMPLLSFFSVLSLKFSLF